MTYTSDDKLQWEVQKLQAEAKNLSRPFVRQPAFWIGLGTLTLSLGTNLAQLSNAERNRQLAEIKTEKLKLDAGKLEVQKSELEDTLRGQRTQLASLRDELESQQASLGVLRRDIANAGATRESLLRSVTDLEQRTANLDKLAETTARTLASSSAPTKGTSRDTEKAAQLELQGFQAITTGDFVEARRLFEASENAANGFRYSYEWARLLRTRQSELSNAEGQKSILQFALSKGYASYAPDELRAKLRQLAQ
jgi:DNA gyrase/topoisomerase IV subunit A